MTTKKATFQKYPAYKDSGVEWLGEIPEHWKFLSNKNIFKLKKNQVGKKSSDYVLLSLTLRGIIERVIEDGGKFPSEFDTYQEVKKGDFVFCLFDVEETPRCVGLSDFEGMITGAYTVMEVNSKFDKAFLYYFYLNLDADKRMRPLYTGLRNTISKDNFFAFKTFVPPLIEQTTIANFLDDKTAKIDRAIAQKEKMIALLKERKQIIIQHAVTKGLDPNVKMKDSGVEWIGEVPEHWEVSKAKFYSKIFVPERTKPELDEDIHSGIPWVTTDLLGENYLDIQKAKYFVSRTNAQIAGSRVIKKESVLATCVGNFGVASINNFECIINQQIQGYTHIKINPMYFIQIVRLSKDFFSNNSTMTTIQYVSKETFGELPILTPSIQEQTAIVVHIEAQSAKIDKAISLQEQQIAKLKELKSTLIDSAVTGKIKVI